jgi:limonene-1,2-epoxide hydrolase
VREDNVPESRNVQLLREYHDALQSSDGERMADMLAPELRYWISPGSDFSGTHDKASILALLPAIFDAQSTKLTYHDITAQDDRRFGCGRWDDAAEIWWKLRPDLPLVVQIP